MTVLYNPDFCGTIGMSIRRSLMAIPDGYDLFEYGWPPQCKEWLNGEQVKLHPLYQTFLKKSKEIGFAIDCEGFEQSEEVYFNFFLAGKNCGVI